MPRCNFTRIRSNLEPIQVDRVVQVAWEKKLGPVTLPAWVIQGYKVHVVLGLKLGIRIITDAMGVTSRPRLRKILFYISQKIQP